MPESIKKDKLIINSSPHFFIGCAQDFELFKSDIERKLDSMFFWFKDYSSSSDDVIQFA